MKKAGIVAMAVVGAALLGGCTTQQERLSGAAAGAAGGAVIGGPIGAAVGGVGGALAGPAVARETR